MSRLKYEFDRRPLTPPPRNGGGRKFRIVALFGAVALVTAGVIYALIPGKTGKETAPVPPAAEKAGESPSVPEKAEPQSPAETPKAEESRSELPEEMPPEAEVIPEPAEEPPASEGEEKPAPLSDKGRILPSDPPAELDQPERPERSAADEIRDLRLKAESGDPAAAELTAARLENLAPGSAEYAAGGEILTALRFEAWNEGSWKKQAVAYRVVSGDSLSRIAKKYHTTIELICRANQLKSHKILIGQTLKLCPGPWRVRVSCKARLLTLLHERDGKERIFAVFSIGVGRNDCTPRANFVISYRLRHPVWYAADGSAIPYGDKRNVLGDYFLKLAPTGSPDRSLLGYGIHGTNDESTVGRSVSHGCIRMRKDDLEMLYYLLPSGTPVDIGE